MRSAHFIFVSITLCLFGCASGRLRTLASSDSGAGSATASAEAYAGFFLYSAPSADPLPKTCGNEDFIRVHGCARSPRTKCRNPEEFSYYVGSCWDDKSIGLFDWKPETLTVTPEHLARLGVDPIARAIVYHLYRRYEEPMISKDAFSNSHHSLYAGISLQILFNDTLVEKIAKTGFKNGHQTHTNNVGLNEKLRWDVEEKFLHVSLPREQPKSAEIAPKYLLGIPIQEVVEGGFGFDDYNWRYGNVLAVFRHGDLKNRTTLTMGDSLILGQSTLPVAARTMKWLQTDSAKVEGAYIEAQVWGTLDFSHVERFLVNCPRFAPISNRRIAEIYESTGIPVYSCQDATDEFGAHQMKPYKLLRGKEGDRFQPNRDSGKSWFPWF